MNGRALVAHNLRRLRVARGISQEALAADAGVDRSYLGGLEREVQSPTVDLLERIAVHLGARLGEFFVEPAPGEPPPAPLKAGRKPRR